MRISDWSSDVCSSDLVSYAAPSPTSAPEPHRKPPLLPTEYSVPRWSSPILFHKCDAFSEQVLFLNMDSIYGLISNINRPRSEEHTSELQSLMRLSLAVFFLKKKTISNSIIYFFLYA